MVRSIHKTKILFAVALIIMPALIMQSAHADENLTFNVNVAESLTVTITNPDNWAVGDTGSFLRNKVNVAASTNNPVGVTVSMYTKNTTELRNTTTYNSGNAATYIPTLASATTAASFPANRWGYSVDDTTAGSTTANYSPLQTSAIQLFTGTANNNKDVYFGAKADNTKQSGTYAQTVYFAAVTGTIDTTNNPAQPTTPSNPDPVIAAAHYNSTNNQTTYTTRTTSGSGTSPVSGAVTSTSTQVTKGDVTSSYAQAYGVTTTSNNDDSNITAAATAFAVSAAVAAVSGTAFFVAAKGKLA